VSIDTLASIIAGGQPTDINRDSFAERTGEAIESQIGSPIQRPGRVVQASQGGIASARKTRWPVLPGPRRRRS